MNKGNLNAAVRHMFFGGTSFVDVSDISKRSRPTRPQAEYATEERVMKHQLERNRRMARKAAAQRY